MLNVFTLAQGRLVQQEIDSPDSLATAAPVWVDLESPSPMEKGWMRARFGLAIPDDIVDDDLEESARFYEEDNGELHIRSDFLIDDDVTPRNVRVAFILKDGVLFSVHGEDLPVFRLLRLRARRIPALIDDGRLEARALPRRARGAGPPARAALRPDPQRPEAARQHAHPPLLRQRP